MKRTMTIICMLAFAAFANVQSEFLLALSGYDCELVKWVENDYESGEQFKHYAKVSCNEKYRLPLKIAGLKFLDISKSLAGKFIYTYGEQ